MGITDHQERSEVNPERSEHDFLGILRVAARIALLAGAAGSVGLMLRAGHRTPRLLLLLFVFWVLAPFVALASADAVSQRWSAPTRATLYGVTLVIALGSLVIYADDALRPRTAQAAFVFVVVPLASWMLTAIAIPIAAFLTGRPSGRR
jgi:hypothetical protein